MKLIALFLCCFASGLVLFGCTKTAPTNSSAPSSSGSGPASTTPDSASNARAIYARDCESCHGATGEGGTVKVEEKTLKVPSLKSARAQKHSDEEYIKQITEGGDGMPAFKDKLKTEEIHAMVKLVRRDIQGQ